MKRKSIVTGGLAASIGNLKIACQKGYRVAVNYNSSLRPRMPCLPAQFGGHCAEAFRRIFGLRHPKKLVKVVEERLGRGAFVNTQEYLLSKLFTDTQKEELSRVSPLTLRAAFNCSDSCFLI
jgi:hypothetical protein